MGVLGTALNLRYTHQLAPLLSGSRVPPNVRGAIEGSLGGALAAAQRAPEGLGELLTRVARASFISGMDLALLIATGVIGLAALVVVLALPSWSPEQRHSGRSGPAPGPESRVEGIDSLVRAGSDR